MSIFILKPFNNLALSSLFTKLLFSTQIHGHERSSINNVELLGTTWEHKRKKKGREEDFTLPLEPYPLGKGIKLMRLKLRIQSLDGISIAFI